MELVNKRDAQKLEEAQMRFLRPLWALKLLDCWRNSNIRNRLQIDNSDEDSKARQKTRLCLVTRRDINGLPTLYSYLHRASLVSKQFLFFQLMHTIIKSY